MHGTVVICTFCRSAQHRSNGPCRSNMAATLARLGVNFGQQGPQLGPIGPNFGPTWLQDGATWPQLGLIWEQGPYGFKMGDIASPIRNPQSARLHWYLFPCFFNFAIDDALIEAIFSRCVSSGPQLGVKLSPKVPSCCMLELTRTFMCITCVQTCPSCAMLGPKLRPKWPEFGRSSAQVGPKWALFGPT